ncbi:C-terminal domain of homeodomain 1-domain-containing protein [Desarmillaria ectypa]|nr:C-terminal domain of homeodomain 1-domain-containing protein [Desarmillaria ectypa]
MAKALAEPIPIYDRLFSTIDNFFTAHSSSSDDHASQFTSQWQSLYTDTLQSHTNGSLQKDTANLAYGVADAIDIVCEALLELDVADDKIASRYNFRGAASANSAAASSSSRIASSCAYVEPAYRWLSDNLHNPYPNREVRNKICRETNTSRKDLDNWFTNARRRMGWTSLLKHFDGDRDRMVEAATTYFSGQTCPWDNQYSPVDIAFADMASTLKDLYANKFEQSTLGRKLGGVVKNMTPELQEQEQVNKKRREEQREAERRAKKVRMEKAKKEDARRAYPSPDRSPGRPPDPSLPSEATPTTRKRRISDDDEDSDNDAHRSKKRSRTDDNDDAVTSLPSPSPTDTEDSDSSRDSTPTPSPSKRKRRLSDSDGAGTFKRHRGIHGSHRSVSDPSSSTSAKTECRPVELYVPPDLEGWFETALAEFPPDPEADVFNYSAMSPSSHYSDEASSAGPSTPRLATPVELPANSIAPSMTLLNNGSILDSISTPEFSISGLDLEGLLPAAIPAEKQPLVSDPAHLSDLDAFLASFSGNNLFSASPDFADIDFSSTSSAWKLAENW